MEKETPYIKPAYQSLEGQSLAGVLLGGLYLLKEVLGSNASNVVSPEALTKYANTVQEVAASVQAGGMPDLTALASTGKSGIILFFMYKIYIKFIDSRTEIKKEALRNRFLDARTEIKKEELRNRTSRES